MKKLTGQKLRVHFMKNNNLVFDTTHGLIFFPYKTKLLKTTANKISAKPHPVPTVDSPIIPPMRTKIITAFVDNPSNWNTTKIVKSMDKFAKTASLIVQNWMWTKIDK